MVRYDLITAAYGIQYGKPLLYVWGRDINREKKLFVLKNEKPHFWVPAEEAERVKKYAYCQIGKETKDIFGSSVVEILTITPKQVGELRRKGVFSRTYQADVLFPQAMLTKRGIYGSFEIIDGKMIPCETLNIPLKVAIWDIEVLSPPEIFPDPEKAEYPINSVAIWNSYGKFWMVYVYKEGEQRRNDMRKEDDIPTYYHIYGNERDLLYDVIVYFEEENFDVLTGWNSNSFDMLTFFNRSKFHRLPVERISPVGAVYKRSAFTSKTYMKSSSEVQASGIILFDGLTAYKKVMVARGELESYSLAYVAEYELKKERIIERQSDLVARGDVIETGNYPRRDADWTRMILDKRRVITYFDNIRRLTGCRLEDATINSKLLDSYCLHKARDKGFVLPSKPRVPKEYQYKGGDAAYEGAVVRQPIVGRHLNVGVVDFSSYYPNAMIGCNMSPETLVGKVRDPNRTVVEVGNGVAFYNDVKGFVPELLEELKIARAFYTDQMDVIAEEKGTTNEEWDILYWLQFAVKFINTAFYGVFAYVGFRLYVLEISDSTTFICRRAMNYGIEYVENELPESTFFDHIVLYGDTDSFFLTLEVADPDYLQGIVDKINHELIELAVEHNMVEGFQIKPERIFKSFILKDAKKKYFGEMVWKDGALIDSDDPARFQVVGFAAKRSDSSRFTRRVQKTVLIMIVEFKSLKEIIEYVDEAIAEIKGINVMVSSEKLIEFGIPKGFSSPRKLQRRNDPWARGARYAYMHYDKLILQHLKPKLLYVNYPGGMIESTWWLATKEASFDVPEKFPGMLLEYLDYNRMIEKCLELKIKPILDVIGIDWGEVSHGQTSLKRFFG